MTQEQRPDWEINPDNYQKDENGDFILKLDGTPKKKMGKVKCKIEGTKGQFCILECKIESDILKAGNFCSANRVCCGRKMSVLKNTQ